MTGFVFKVQSPWLALAVWLSLSRWSVHAVQRVIHLSSPDKHKAAGPEDSPPSILEKHRSFTKGPANRKDESSHRDTGVQAERRPTEPENAVKIITSQANVRPHLERQSAVAGIASAVAAFEGAGEVAAAGITSAVVGLENKLAEAV